MISQTSGATTYSTIDQLPRPAAEKPPAATAEPKDTVGGGSTVADKTDISAKALALSKTIQQPGASSEQQETRASEQGETTEETQPPQPTPQQPSPSINIRV